MSTNDFNAPDRVTPASDAPSSDASAADAPAAAPAPGVSATVAAPQLNAASGPEAPSDAATIPLPATAATQQTPSAELAAASAQQAPDPASQETPQALPTQWEQATQWANPAQQAQTQQAQTQQIPGATWPGQPAAAGPGQPGDPAQQAAYAQQPGAHHGTSLQDRRRAGRPRTGPIVWGVLLLVFCGYVAQSTFAGPQLDTSLWVIGTVVGLGVLLLGVGVAVLMRGRGK